MSISFAVNGRTFLQLMGIIARFTHSSEEVWCATIGAPYSPIGFTHDARTAILARFRYMGLDVEIDRMYAEFQKRSQTIGMPSNATLWINADGRPAL